MQKCQTPITPSVPPTRFRTFADSSFVTRVVTDGVGGGAGAFGVVAVSSVAGGLVLGAAQYATGGTIDIYEVKHAAKVVATGLAGASGVGMGLGMVRRATIEFLDTLRGAAASKYNGRGLYETVRETLG